MTSTGTTVLREGTYGTKVVAVALFCNQTLYVAPVPAAVPAVGDITFEIGFLLAAALYAALLRRPARWPEPRAGSRHPFGTNGTLVA